MADNARLYGGVRGETARLIDGCAWKRVSSLWRLSSGHGRAHSVGSHAVFGAADVFLISGSRGFADGFNSSSTPTFNVITSRSEERRVGKEGVSMWRYRWPPYH